jgi:2-polyprenyl-3-methyl-5-hydroxy-6-metoxy-1,4-benzoquinol methylase
MLPPATSPGRRAASPATSAATEWKIDQFDVQNLVEPLGRDRFDLVFCLETLEHVPDHDLALRELVAVTKPGGRIIV